jgi:hypothetical protein
VLTVFGQGMRRRLETFYEIPSRLSFLEIFLRSTTQPDAEDTWLMSCCNSPFDSHSPDEVTMFGHRAGGVRGWPGQSPATNELVNCLFGSEHSDRIDSLRDGPRYRSWSGTNTVHDRARPHATSTGAVMPLAVKRDVDLMDGGKPPPSAQDLMRC